MPRKKRMIPIENLNQDSREMKEHIKLGEIMKEKKIRQNKLAEHLGVKQSTVSNWRTGRTPMPSNYVYDICVYLDITPNILFGLERK